MRSHLQHRAQCESSSTVKLMLGGGLPCLRKWDHKMILLISRKTEQLQSRNIRCSSGKTTLENPQNDLSESGYMGVARRVSHHQALVWAPHKRCSLSRFTRPHFKIYHLCERNRTCHIDAVNCKTCLFSDSFGMPQTVCELLMEVSAGRRGWLFS